MLEVVDEEKFFSSLDILKMFGLGELARVFLMSGYRFPSKPYHRVAT